MSGETKGEALSPTELWEALTTMPRPHRRVPFPRKRADGSPVGHVVIWPLTQEEQMAANSAADRFTKELLKDPQKKDEANLGYHHTYTNEVAVQVLFRACRHEADFETRPAFPTPAAMRAKLTTDEIGTLFNHYCTVQQEVGPIVAFMSKDEREGMILRLQQGGTAFPFDTLSWEMQRTLVLSMASQLVACWTDMFCAGLQPDVTPLTKEFIQDRLPKESAPDPEGESSETSPRTDPTPPSAESKE